MLEEKGYKMNLLNYIDEYFFLKNYTINLKKIEDGKNHFKILKGSRIIKSGFVKSENDLKEKLKDYLTPDFYKLVKIKSKLFLHKKYLLGLTDGKKAIFKNYCFDNLKLDGLDFTECVFENCTFKNVDTKYVVSIPEEQLF